MYSKGRARVSRDEAIMLVGMLNNHCEYSPDHSLVLLEVQQEHAVSHET